MQRLKYSMIFIIILLSINIGFLNAGEIIYEAMPSNILGYNWPLHIYIPEGYQQDSRTEYPTLFLLHGSNGKETDFDRIFPLIDSLILTKQVPPLIAVTPATGTSWWVDGREKFETAFIKELIPYVSNKYHLVESRTARVVAGFSMGGYGALRYGLAYPEIFGGAILLSPAIYEKLPPAGSSARTSGVFGIPFSDSVWIARNFSTILPDYIQQEHRVSFFISAGDDDWNHEEGVEYNVEQQVVHLYGMLNKKYRNPAELRIVNGSHNWKLWRPLFYEGLLYISRVLPTFLVSE